MLLHFAGLLTVASSRAAVYDFLTLNMNFKPAALKTCFNFWTILVK